MVEHYLVGPGMPGLLLDERLDRRLQIWVIDQRGGLEDRFNEMAFALGQQQMQHVHHVRRERVVGHPMQRGVRPVEAHHPSIRRVSIVVKFNLWHSAPPAAPEWFWSLRR